MLTQGGKSQHRNWLRKMRFALPSLEFLSLLLMQARSVEEPSLNLESAVFKLNAEKSTATSSLPNKAACKPAARAHGNQFTAQNWREIQSGVF